MWLGKQKDMVGDWHTHVSMVYTAIPDWLTLIRIMHWYGMIPNSTWICSAGYLARFWQGPIG